MYLVEEGYLLARITQGNAQQGLAVLAGSLDGGLNYSSGHVLQTLETRGTGAGEGILTLVGILRAPVEVV